MPTSSRRRYLHWALALLLVAGLVTVLAWPRATLVDSAPVTRGPVREVVEAEGRTRLRDRYVITAPIAATARRLELQPGDAVAAGQVLVTLDPMAAPALDARALAQARAQVSAARSRVAATGEAASAASARARQAEADAARLQGLGKQQLVAAAAVEQARTGAEQARREARSARYQEATARHELAAAQAVLDQGSGVLGNAALQLTAPVGGTVLRRHYESSRPVQPGEPLLEIGDPAALEIEVDVLSTDAVRLRPGMRAELVRWGEQQALEGRVRRVEPGGFTKISALGVEEQRVWVLLDITSPAALWHHLGDAYRVNVRFVLREAPSTLRVPESAVFTHGNQPAVFRIVRHRAVLTPVGLGLQGEGQAQVVDGLSLGQTVIVHPDRALEADSRVRDRAE